jgi:hypothetical protein
VRRAFAISLAVLMLGACGAEDDLRVASDGVFSCDSRTVRVDFDPATKVTVKAGDASLAMATFTERQVSEDCSPVPDAPRTTMESSPYDDRLLAKPVYRRAAVDCDVSRGVRIYVHPIFNADVGRNSGSVLLLVDGTTIVVSAVLKHKGDRLANRVYHAPRYCTAA